MGMSNPGHDRRAAWRAALACMVTLSVAMGLGRFAFTPMLPLMLHEGRLDLQGGGLLASLNYLGYFLGAVSCASLRVRAATMVRGGLLATAAPVRAAEGEGFAESQPRCTAWAPAWKRLSAPSISKRVAM